MAHEDPKEGITNDCMHAEDTSSAAPEETTDDKMPKEVMDGVKLENRTQSSSEQ